MAYALDFAIALGSSKAGLADLRAQLYDSAGAPIGDALSTGFADLGEGCYLWHAEAIPTGHRGGVSFYSDAAPSVTLAIAAINPEEAEHLDAPLSGIIATVEAVGITVLSPVIPETGVIKIRRGDDYLASTTPDRSIRLTFPGQPDFTGAQLVTLKAKNDEIDLYVEGEAIAADTVRIELDHALTWAQPHGAFKADVEIITADGNRVCPFQQGPLKIIDAAEPSTPTPPSIISAVWVEFDGGPLVITFDEPVTVAGPIDPTKWTLRQSPTLYTQPTAPAGTAAQLTLTFHNAGPSFTSGTFNFSGDDPAITYGPGILLPPIANHPWTAP